MTDSSTRIARRIAVVGCATLTVGFLTVPHTTLAGYSQGASCSATTITMAPPNSPGPWLDIKAAGLQASKWYSVFAVTPGGQNEGVAVYADASGSLETTSLAAPSSGTYHITVNRFHTTSEVTGCAFTS